MSELHVRVRLGGEHYALRVEDVLEVAEYGEAAAVPGAPATVLGVRNLRGSVLAVVDLAAIFDVARTGSPQRVVVVEHRGRRCGLAVEEVLGVDSLPDAREDVDSPHLSGAVLVDGALVGLVDVGTVLDAGKGVPA
jgi:chemotaxis signal transduction protein